MMHDLLALDELDDRRITAGVLDPKVDVGLMSLRLDHHNLDCV